jgi:hypothetical protein
MNTSILRTTAAALLIGLAGAANAATTLVDVAADGTFTVNDTTAPGVGGTATFDIDPTTAPIDAVYIDTNPGSQNPDTIGNLIEAAYGLPGTALIAGSECPTASCSLSVTGNTLTVSTLAAFDYLAVHLGGAELFFHWASPITSASLTILNSTLTGAGFSNWRTYSAVPLPGAAFLFLSALGFLGLRRKVTGGQPTPA